MIWEGSPLKCEYHLNSVSQKRYIIRDYGFLLYEFSRCVFNFDLKTRKHWNSTFKWFWGNLLGFDTLKKNHHCVSIRRTVQIKRGLVDFICIFNPDKLNDYLKRSRGGEQLGFNCFYRKVRTGENSPLPIDCAFVLDEKIRLKYYLVVIYTGWPKNYFRLVRS